MAYLDIVDEDLAETGRQHVLCQLGRTVTDVGHFVDTLEAATNTVVNTLGFPPVLLDLVITITLVADEPLGPLLDNLRALCWCDGHLA